MLPAMEFAVEFYETAAGRRPVEEFLLKLKASDLDDFRSSDGRLGETASPAARDLDTARERRRDWMERHEG